MKLNLLQKRESFFLIILVVASMTACHVEPGDDEEPGDPAEMSAEEVAEQRADEELVESVGTAEQALAVNTVTDAQATEWELRDNGAVGPMMSGRKYSLFNTYHGSYIKNGHQTLGINLVWTDAPSTSVSMTTRNGQSPRFGDSVALNVNGDYIYYKKRWNGINLDWSNTPVYEWKLLGGETGTVVKTGTRVRMFNDGAAHDNVVYCTRSKGVNLTWAKDCTVIPLTGRLRTEDVPL